MQRCFGAPLLAVIGFGAGLASPLPSLAQGLPPRFVDEAVLTGLDAPTVVRFHPDGRVFVAEKGGTVRVFDSLDDPTPDTFVDISTRVHDYWDRGLLGMALHPDFANQPYVYLLYAFDAYPGQTGPTWGDQCPNPPGGTADGCVIQGRLSRFRAVGNTVDGSEQVLIQNWCQQFPSHSIGALQFGGDGALYVTGGDGASFNFVDYGQTGDPINPCGDPPVAVGAMQSPPLAEGGALRSQSLRGSGAQVSLDGTLLRLDPATGLGLSDNPLYGGGNASDDGIVAYGLRNPFRFALRPGTSEIWIGDVGWNTWEEIDVVADPTDDVVENFGWPCYEGNAAQEGYDSANLTLCENLYNAAGAHTPPLYAYRHGQRVLATDQCGRTSSSVSGLAFYDGNAFPAEYAGALFFADYSRNCIWAMMPDGSGRPDPSDRQLMRRSAAGPVDLTIGPDGSLYYAAIREGSVRRIRYANGEPTAVISASVASGPAPLQVSFDGGGSSDPDGDALDYAWDLDDDGFDDGGEATLDHEFTAPGSYRVRLRVTDTLGLSHTASVTITVSNTAPVATIGAPLSTLEWHVDDEVVFSGGAQDAEDGTLPAAALSWQIVLHHCAEDNECHPHVVMGVSGVAGGTFFTPDHAYPSYLELELTATDSLGSSAVASVVIEPATAMLVVDSVPPGLSLAIDGSEGPAPFMIEGIVGSRHSIAAASPQMHSAEAYEFDAWSDGGEASHLVTLAQAGSSFTVTFVKSCGNGVLQAGEQCDDGNGDDGDCCSASCQFELEGTACTADGMRCTLDICDGAGACTHPDSDECAGYGEACAENLDCESEHCVNSTCCAGVCDDGDPCTLDVCGSDGTCAPTAIAGCGEVDAGTPEPDAGTKDAGTQDAGTQDAATDARPPDDGQADAAVDAAEPAGTDAAVDAAPTTTSDGGGPSPRDASEPDADEPSERDGSTDGIGGGDASEPDTDPKADDGCSCSVPGSRPRTRAELPLAVGLVIAAGLSRRRRRARRAATRHS